MPTQVVCPIQINPQTQVRALIQTGRESLREGNIDEAKLLAKASLQFLQKENSSDNTLWQDLTELSAEIAAIQLIWKSYQTAKGKTISFLEFLQKLNAANPAIRA